MSGSNGGLPNPVAAAIAAADEKPEVQMAQVPLDLGTTGRRVVVVVPVDINPIELMDLASYICNPINGLGPKLAARRGPQLVVAKGSIPERPS